MASRFWVGGGASTNWDATGNTNWAATSGGAGNASVPTTGDDVFFDANSGVGTSVMNVSLSLRSFDCNGYAGTLTHNTAITLTITGNDATAPGTVTFRLVSGMTYTLGNSASSALSFTSTSGTSTITTGTKTTGNITTNGAGGTFSLGDALTANVLTVTAGVFTANNQNLSILSFSSSNSNTRTITMGSGTWTLRGTSGTIWDTNTITGLTFNKDTSTIDINATASFRRQFASGGAGLTFNNLTITNPSGNSFPVLFGTGPMTFANITTTNVRAIHAGTMTLTISGALTINSGSSTEPIYLGCTSDLSAGKLTLSVAGSNTLSWVFPQNVTKAGAGSITANNSYDLGGNTSVTINAPAGGVTARVIGG